MRSPHKCWQLGLPFLLMGCQSLPFAGHKSQHTGSSELAQRDLDFQPLAPRKAAVAVAEKPTALANKPEQPKQEPKPAAPDLKLVAAEVPAELPAPTLIDAVTPPIAPLTQPEQSVVESTSSALTLADVEQLALQHNPAIQQGAAVAYKAMGIRRQVGRRPNPVVGYQASQLIDRGTDQHIAFIEQDFVLGKKLALSERVIDQEIQVQLWQVEAQRQRVLTDVRCKFHEALAASQRRKLAVDFEQVAKKGVTTAEKRKSVGEATDIESLQAEIQLNEVELIRQQAEFSFENAWKELTALAGVPCLPASTLVGTLDVDLLHIDWEARYCELESSSPQVYAATMRVARAQANLDRQQAQPIPNVNVQLGSGYDNGTGSSMMNVQVGIPLPVHNSNDGNISAAYAEFCEAGQNLQRLKLSLRAQLASVAREFDSAALAVERYRDVILPKAERTLDLSERAYSSQGTVDFLQVLVARRTFFDANLQFNRSQLELAQANDLLNGMLLTGGLEAVEDTASDDALRGQALSGQ